MTYLVEIMLPVSCNWFKYVPGILTREEAENIKRVADRRLKARLTEE